MPAEAFPVFVWDLDLRLICICPLSDIIPAVRRLWESSTQSSGWSVAYVKTKILISLWLSLPWPVVLFVFFFPPKALDDVFLFTSVASIYGGSCSFLPFLRVACYVLLGHEHMVIVDACYCFRDAIKGLFGLCYTYAFSFQRQNMPVLWLLMRWR